MVWTGFWNYTQELLLLAHDAVKVAFSCKFAALDSSVVYTHLFCLGFNRLIAKN